MFWSCTRLILFTEEASEKCSTELSIARKICNVDICKYTTNVYEAQREIYLLKSSQLKYKNCVDSLTLKECSGEIWLHKFITNYLHKMLRS